MYTVYETVYNSVLYIRETFTIEIIELPLKNPAYISIFKYL